MLITIKKKISQARPKILKKLLKHQINQLELTYNQKSMFSNLKV
jgi:hypothetical protein